jgi:2-methylcitrate dehydratase PrpD
VSSPSEAVLEVTAPLCHFATSLRWEALPPATRSSVVETIANSFALMISAASHPAVEIAVRSVEQFGSGPLLPLLGRTDSLSAPCAAFAEGVAAHVDDFDDTHPETIIHPGPPVVAAALSAALTSGASGRQFVEAVAAGVEVSLRLGLGLVPESLRRGWHSTGICGPVGAAVAAGKLVLPGGVGLTDAIGLAATQAAGVGSVPGSMAKALHVGKAAANGYQAAELALSGVKGPDRPLEGGRGLFASISGAGDPHRVVADLGERWEIDRNEIKPYACGVLGHSLIDIASTLYPELAGSGTPKTVRLRVNPLVAKVMGQQHPRSGLESKFSAVHCFAVALLTGRGGPAQFLDSVACDPVVVDLRERCVLVADESLSRYAAVATIDFAQGEITRSRPGPDRMVADRVRQKCLDLAAQTLGSAAANFVELAFRIEDQANLDGLVSAARPGLLSVPTTDRA